jgi:hypothetical protein
MMCDCDRDFGERYLPHQIEHGQELHTRREVLVTLGFQPGICRECRGLPPEAAPVAAGHGRSSKIQRYYWREISMETTRRMDKWLASIGLEYSLELRFKYGEMRDEIEKEVISHFKELHAKTPKYSYTEPSSDQILRQCSVEVISIPYRRAENGESMASDEVAAAHYRELGFKVMFCESIPFHVLFGVFMYLLIEDPGDPHNRIVGFGNRYAVDEGRSESEPVMTHLPDDFGGRGYGHRRRTAIHEHLAWVAKEDINTLFDYWLRVSDELRQYLWAHREKDVARARVLLDRLPKDALIRILDYLVSDYWGNYLGWPDLFVYDAEQFFFVEAKKGGDRLSAEQKHWVQSNHKILQLPFKLAKVHAAPKQPRISRKEPH